LEDTHVQKRILQSTQIFVCLFDLDFLASACLGSGRGEASCQHAGIGETSLMLYLEPELVKMERAEKPKMIYTEKMAELFMLTQQYPDLLIVLSSLQGVPVETKKGGASHELSSNGIWSLSDPKKATKERGEKQVEGMVSYAVKFIEAWRQAKK